MSSNLHSFNLVFSKPIQDKKQVASAILSSMNVRRLIFLNTGCPDKHTYDSAILVVVSDVPDLPLLSKPVTEIAGVSLKVQRISLEQAEWAIDQKRTKIYVGNIPYPTDNETLWKHFAKFGTLDYTYIVKKPTKNGQKGFGYVIYKDRNSLEHALSIKHYLLGAKLNCKLFLNKGKLKRRIGEPDEMGDELAGEHYSSCAIPPKVGAQDHYRHVHHHHHVIPPKKSGVQQFVESSEQDLYCFDSAHDHIHQSNSPSQYGLSSLDTEPGHAHSTPQHQAFLKQGPNRNLVVSGTPMRKPLKLTTREIIIEPQHETKINHRQEVRVDPSALRSQEHLHPSFATGQGGHCYYNPHSSDGHSHGPTFGGHHHSHHHTMEHQQQHHHHHHHLHWVHAHHTQIQGEQVGQVGAGNMTTSSDAQETQSLDESMSALRANWSSRASQDENCDQHEDCSEACSDDQCEDLLCIGQLCQFQDPKLALEEHLKNCPLPRLAHAVPADTLSEDCKQVSNHTDCCEQECYQADCCQEGETLPLYQDCEVDPAGNCEFQLHLKSKLSANKCETAEECSKQTPDRLCDHKPTVVCCWAAHDNQEEAHCDKHHDCTSADTPNHAGCIGKPCTDTHCAFSSRQQEIKQKQRADKPKMILRPTPYYKPL